MWTHMNIFSQPSTHILYIFLYLPLSSTHTSWILSATMGGREIWQQSLSDHSDMFLRGLSEDSGRTHQYFPAIQLHRPAARSKTCPAPQLHRRYPSPGGYCDVWTWLTKYHLSYNHNSETCWPFVMLTPADRQRERDRGGIWERKLEHRIRVWQMNLSRKWNTLLAWLSGAVISYWRKYGIYFPENMKDHIFNQRASIQLLRMAREATNSCHSFLTPPVIVH